MMRYCCLAHGAGRWTGDVGVAGKPVYKPLVCAGEITAPFLA